MTSRTYFLNFWWCFRCLISANKLFTLTIMGIMKNIFKRKLLSLTVTFTGWPLILELLENTGIYWKNISYWNYTWKILLFRKKLKIWKMYWNYTGILILENTGIILTRLTKWTSHYFALNSSRWPLFEYISLNIWKIHLRRAFKQHSDT